MTTRQQWGIVAAVVVVLAGGLWAAVRLLGHELFPVTVGSTAPDFQARTLDGTDGVKTISDYRGEVVLLNVWATWCIPCRTEMPSIQALHESFAGQGGGLHVVAVSVDQPGFEQDIRDFAQEYGLSFEILHDASGGIQQAYQTTGIPETYIIDREGVIRRKHIGPADWNSAGNRALVAQLLGVPVPPAAPGDVRRDPLSREIPAAVAVPDTGR